MSWLKTVWGKITAGAAIVVAFFLGGLALFYHGKRKGEADVIEDIEDTEAKLAAALLVREREYHDKVAVIMREYPVGASRLLAIRDLNREYADVIKSIVSRRPKSGDDDS